MDGIARQFEHPRDFLLVHVRCLRAGEHANARFASFFKYVGVTGFGFDVSVLNVAGLETTFRREGGFLHRFLYITLDHAPAAKHVVGCKGM